MFKYLKQAVIAMLAMLILLLVPSVPAYGATGNENVDDGFISKIETAINGYVEQVLKSSPVPSNAFKAGKIIEDTEFYNANGLNPAEIQTFLETQNSDCFEGNNCLKTYTESTPIKPADAYCSELPAVDNDSAANIISRVAVACSINPKVLLVMLEKEQGLITSQNPTQQEYDKAMGQACPDSGPNNTANCDSTYFGFFNQVYYGARQQQVYTLNPENFNYKAGEENQIQWNQNPECGKSSVYIENQATANLYNYTPYQPNLEALTTLHGEGDACSSYGNRNFYVYYTQWFGDGVIGTVPVCSQPPQRDLQPLNQTITVVEETTAYVSPTTKCEVDNVKFSEGTSLVFSERYGEWGKTTYEGKTLWVKIGMVKTSCALPDTTEIFTGSFAVYNTATTANARQAPTTDCSTNITEIPAGTIVTASERSGDWYKVTSEAGSTYWMNIEYLTSADASTELYKTIEEVNYRIEPDTAAPSYGKMPQNYHVGQILEKQENWAKLKIGSRTGWIRLDYLTPIK